MSARRVTVLGATGSVGVSTLELLEQSGVEAEIVALTAGHKAAELADAALKWRPRMAVVAREDAYPELKSRLAGSGIEVAAGETAVCEAARAGAEWVMSAIVGTAGLAPTLAAAETGATLALANKESLVCAGPVLMETARHAGGRVIPVDSEHSAIFQVLQPDCLDKVRRLILTASGGPFRAWTREAMAAVTPAQAVAHPNWSMGAKISVDSATMMNKGLELIEASYLFDMPEAKVDVIVHPQSVVHSLVEYEDGSTLAQLGPPDMKTPIAVAWAWPDRLPWPSPDLNLAAVGRLDFEAPDLARFPALRLAREALTSGGHAPAALNAANEVAVAAFLDRNIPFLDIAAIVEQTLERLSRDGALTRRTNGGMLDAALLVDADARRVAAEAVRRHAA
jgi:1-deoxy-D-xylulose-5-phosphate reductoisomerase